MLRRVYENNRQIDEPPAPDEKEDHREEPSASLPVPWTRYAMGFCALLLVIGLTGWMYHRLTTQPTQKIQAFKAEIFAFSGMNLGPILSGPPLAPDAWSPASSAGMNQVPVTPGETSIASLLGLEVRTIVIDAGHGGADSGAIGPTGLMEKEVTLAVARRLHARLEQYPGYRILLTRSSDKPLSLKERVTFANSHDADLFVSIHVNWIPDSSVTCIETYYFGRGNKEALALARRENQNSGYSVADFNEMIEEIGSTMRRQESRKLAHAIQESVYNNVHRINEHVENWGVKTAPFVVLLGVEAPSVLAEIGVLSNPLAETRLRKPSYRKKLAAFLEEGIINYLNSRGVASTPDSSVTTTLPTS